MKTLIRSLVGSVFFAAPVSAQTFNQFLAFGDSTIDSGYFKYAVGQAGLNEPRYQNARTNGAALTPSSGLMNTQYLASAFGLSAITVSAPGGGTNYAVSGARVNATNLNAGTSPSFVQQINNYLTATGGTANPNALYLLSIGGNDLTFAKDNAISGAAFRPFINPIIASAVSASSRLQAAGARYIVVPNSYAISFASGSGPAIFSQGLWTGLSNAGVNFIPADVNAMRVAIVVNPGRFGFTTVDPQVIGSTNYTSGCHPANNGTGAGFGIFCVPGTTPPNNSLSYQRNATSSQTSLFSDDQHLSVAGQKIEADYIYSLIVAPSQISFLTESTIQARRNVTLGIQEQIDLTQRRATQGFNVWFNGDVSSLKLNNSSAGFPSDPSTPIAGTLGGSYALGRDALIGAAVTLGQFNPTFSLGGGFKEQEVATSVFGAVRGGDLWANAIMSFGLLRYDVNRIVPLGVTFDSNQASTRGHNFSFAAQSGYDFHQGTVTHGPIAGVEIQSVGINAFTETGSFTSLAFSNIGRTSTVSALGYRAAIDYANWRPFAQMTWNHEFDNTSNRTVTATLTSVTATGAPSYSLPIVQFGRDWGVAAVGTTVAFARDWTGLAAFNAQFAQNGTTNYGGRFGINYAFR